ncbi:MAG TPA: molybdenum cofactor guanylyltransferase [Blastocatellia bacterium]|nr:molybdenum cofactor guanylyltransferase [Blastocatellia bacterium]
MQVSGFITAGGRSSRMGRDKAWLRLGESTMIERVIAALKPVTLSLAIIANGEEYKRLGLPVFKDTYAGIGPLEAIRTALANSPTRHVLLAGCDMPFVTSELFSLLVGLAGDHLAVVPRGADGRLEPLCALYARDALPRIIELIEGGERKVSRLFDLIRTRVVDFHEMNHLEGSSLFFENVNTPEEFSRATKLTT